MPTVMDTLHSTVISALDLTAITANIVLVYAIATRLLFVDGSQLYVYVGACSHVGIWFCHLCQSVHTFFVCHSTVILLHSFCFRLYILRDKLVKVSIPTMRTTILICAVLYCPTLFFMSLFYASFEYTPPDLMRELHFDEYPTTWNSHYTETKFVVAMIFVVFLSPSAMVVLFFVRRRLLVEISKSKSDSKEHHANIARALTYQMLLPAGLALACVAWLSSLAEIWKDEMAERLVMTLSSLFALFSPLINLTFLPPYRRMFGRKKPATTIGRIMKICVHQSLNDCDYDKNRIIHNNWRERRGLKSEERR
ncbi:hypothetical protein PRIPAC_81479, partial [Pristionchus pacificus]|uniref:G protein-coupled receptor n=1 Tax=Pristionchus pacificus TaxID=54126 RepID=A0A2A6CPZ3_PRIPA